MYYVDSQRTLIRRDSSLITPRKSGRADDQDVSSLYQGQMSVPLNSESSIAVLPRPRGSVQKELVTLMFESMLHSIVKSWDLIPSKQADSTTTVDIGKVGSETFSAIAGKKKKPIVKSSRTKPVQSRSKHGSMDTQDSQVSWWSGPDERAIIHFRNGNLYEGNISMKCMHGEGRFQWANGTVYLGQFRENEICGKGFIQWKDDTWYQGEFAGNLRHGKGLYVNSRLQRSYAGGWHCGTKHGQGVIYYDDNFNNSYDGNWIHNERFGYGIREYCASSGFKGDWERNIREGKGSMIWPNSDCYHGEWKNGSMSGYGIYIWDAYYNNTMSLPSLKAYRGQWEKGLRNGYGLLNLGLGLGSFYKGEFKNNKKHGVGQFVTNNGLILKDKKLFVDDNLGPFKSFESNSSVVNHQKQSNTEPLQFDICDSTVGLFYHIQQAFNNIDKREETITNIVNNYLEFNKTEVPEPYPSQMVPVDPKQQHEGKDHKVNDQEYLKNLMSFEEISIRKALKCYETDLRRIYYKYATICNTEEIHFIPVMIRLYLWQLYNDCNIHVHGLTLYDIDILFYQNREWLARNPHDPFEKIYIWQFLHSLISVANKLYAKRTLPGSKPDTILASGFRTFMEQDVLPGSNQQRGRLVTGYGSFIPLRATYELYRKLGEPHTIRKFLRAVRRAPHYLSRLQPPMIDALNKFIPYGRNCYVFGDEISFVVDDKLPQPHPQIITDDLDLFNFANLSNKTIIEIFSKIFPKVIRNDKVIDLEIKLTFYDFFEVFIECAEESIRVKEEELRWRERFASNVPIIVPHSPPTGY